MTAPRRPRSAWFVGRLDALDLGEGPQRRPALEQVLGEEAVVLRLGALARGLLEQRPQLLLERGDPLQQAGAVASPSSSLAGPTAACERAAATRDSGSSC